MDTEMDEARELWLAVLRQQIVDATDHVKVKRHRYYLLRNPNIVSIYIPRDIHNWRIETYYTLSYETRTARHWLTSNSEDFRMVCEYADFNPDVVRKWALKAEKDNWPPIDIGLRKNFPRAA